MNKIGTTSLNRFFYIIFRIFGLWFSTNSRIYKTYAFILHMTFTFMYTAFMLMNLILVTDIREATHALYMTLTITSMFIRVMCFLWHNSRIRLCLESIHYFDIQSKDEAKLLERQLKPFKNLVIVFFVSCIAVLAMAFVQVLFETQPKLPFPCWYPVDWKHNRRDYWIAYSYQTSGMIMGLNTNVGIHLFSCYLMHMIRFWMEVLGVRLTKLGSNLKNEIAERQTIEAMKESEFSIVKCITLHQTLIKLKNEFERSFTIAFFADICTGGITICMLAYQLAVISPRDYIIYCFYVGFLLVITAQIFLPCYFGNEVKFQSTLLPISAYSSNWYLLSPMYKRHLITFMEALKKETEILVGKIFPLSLNTFTSICSFSYKLFTLLQSVQK